VARRPAVPVELQPFRFAAIRYRAHHLAGWGDYFVWLGGQSHGQHREHAVVSLDQLRDDGAWHVAVVPLRTNFTAAELALQVSSDEERGEVWLDRITFSSHKPLLDPQDLLPIAPDWTASRLSPGCCRVVDLATLANASAASLLDELELRHWLAPGRVTVRGIPFQTLAAATNILTTTDNIADVPAIPINAAGSELYWLMAASLPDRSFTGVLGSAPLRRFNNPERFVFQVHYADGLTDDMVPVCLGSSANEIQHGLQVYCLPNLRRVEVTRVDLRNRIESARFVVVAVTMNTGAWLTAVPPVTGLPPSATVAPVEQAAPSFANVSPTADGIVLENPSLRMVLQTSGGLALRNLESRCLDGGELGFLPGPLFDLGAGQTTVPSDRLQTSAPSITRPPTGPQVRVPFDGAGAGVPIRGDFCAAAHTNGDIRLWLELTYAGEETATPVVHFPSLHGLRVGAVADTWYLWACKGGIIHTQRTEQAQYYGGEYPLQVADIFNPALGVAWRC